nr:hypothetical protein [Actinomycetota bacterium]
IPHPRVLTAEDFDDIASAPDLYARKFDTALDARILDLIDERLLSDEEAGRQVPPSVGSAR